MSAAVDAAGTTLRCSAAAKLNLSLFVGPLLEDGRHQLVTVFQPLDLVDLVEATLAPELSGDRVVCPGVEGTNLAATALAAYRAETGWDGPPIRLTITKQIPVAGGMAGGSADAAAALRLVARFAGDADVARLESIAAGLGADVPSQVQGRRMIGTGVGGTLRASRATPDWEALVLSVDAALSAGAVFTEADRLTAPRDADAMKELELAVRAAERGIGVEQAGLAINDLEHAARRLCPAIDDALVLLKQHGAEHAMVSGSGPTVVGLFAPGAAAAAHAVIATQRPAILARPEGVTELDVARWP